MILIKGYLLIDIKCLVNILLTIIQMEIAAFLALTFGIRYHYLFL
ncbi:hypothetical protein SAMN05216436_10691 [bacterium A37T11]|nr:hypothetical protein SAMN05216436_10691 [bacterium A37T11]